MQELQGQIAQEKKRFSDEHPTIVALQNQASDLENSLQQSMQKNLGKSSEFSLGNLQILQQKNLSPELTSSLLEAEAEKQRADEAQQRAENLLAQLHAAGIEPNL